MYLRKKISIQKFKRRRYFCKEYLYLKHPEDIRLEFKKADLIHRGLKKSKRFSSPKPLEIKGNKIIYEYIEGSITLKEYIKSQNTPSLIAVFYNLGIGLAKIHYILNRGQNLKSTSQSIKIYGDFAPNNIMLVGNTLHFIDFEACEMFDFEVFMKGKISEELAYFWYCFSTPNLKNISLFFKDYSILEYAFLNGYLNESGLLFDMEDYYTAKKEILARNIGEKFSEMAVIRKLSYPFRKAIDIYRLKNIQKIYQNNHNYRSRYKSKENAKSYDGLYDNTEQYYTYIWDNYEKPCLEDIAKKSGRDNKYLDFACGSGRVICVLEKYFSKSLGIDISKEMVLLAKKRCKRSKFRVADITKNKISLAYQPDIITSFRFFLHAQPLLREEVFFRLSKVLAEDGRIILNIHGNKYSFHGIYALLSRLSGRPIASLSYREVKGLCNRNNLKIKKIYGFGFLPRFMKKVLGAKLYRRFDDYLKDTPLKIFGFSVVYICEKKYPGQTFYKKNL
jgi:2-polyprenyl-3-methyl-5-hydroxy-6-metoxy-1,4-benzoquinol methylase